MMKPVRTLGAAVVALAAPALFTLPAAAGPGRGAVATVETRISDNTTLTLALGSSGYDSHRSHGPDYRRGLNEWGQTDREAYALARDAVQACRQAVRQEARDMGYREIEFYDDLRTRQVGRYGFLVHFDEVEFESRRRNTQTRVTCEIRRGYVVAIEGIPRPYWGRGHRRDW